MKRDILWKSILEDVFDDFLRFFIPDVDRFLDLSRGIEYLDKELDQLFPPVGNEYKPRYVDKLAKVHTRRGTEEWVLVHVEVQGYRDNQFAKRMFQYYTRIWDKYERPVVAFAIFTDSSRGFHPNVFEQSFLGTSLCYKFNTYKIIEQSEIALTKDPNPFASVVLTVKTALNGKKISSQELYNLKISIASRLVAIKMDKAKRGKMMDFLRNYVRFENQEMSDNFEKEIAVFSPNIESMGIQEFLLTRAKKEGVQETLNKVISQLLKKQFSPEQIAETLDVSVAFVLSVQEEEAE
jgi:Trp operon repressor